MKTHKPRGWPRLLADWRGLTVKSKRKLSNGYGSLPPGTTFTIRSAGNGVSLQSKPCSECGFAMYVTRVDPRDLVLVKESE